MKKYIISILLLAALSIAAVTGFSANKQKEIEKAVEKTEMKTSEKLSKAFKSKDMEKILRQNGLYEDEIKRNMTDYLRCIVDYSMSEEVNDILLSETEKGKDLDKLIKIYQFLYMANQDYSLIDEIYEMGSRSNFKSSYWLEEAYNETTEYIGGVLDGEQILTYVDKGLTYDDIMLANNLCFKGKMKINEILDQKLKGKSWVEIVNVIYPQLKMDKNTYGSLEPLELYEYVTDALIYEENINEMYDKKEKKSSEKYEKQMAKRYEKLNEAVKNKNVSFILDDSMTQYAKGVIPQLAEEDIKNLMQEGYLIREIKRGYELSLAKNIPVKKAIEKDFKGGRE